MSRCEARCPECTWVSMKPGQTSLPRASISSSTVPEKAPPTWTMRSFSHTTTPSRTSVWPWPAKPTTQPPRMSPRIPYASLSLGEGEGRGEGRSAARRRLIESTARPLILSSPPGGRGKRGASAGDEGARLGDFRALAVGGRGHREEAGVVRLGQVAVARQLGRLSRALEGLEAVGGDLERGVVLGHGQRGLLRLEQHVTEQLAGERDRPRGDVVLLRGRLELGGRAHQGEGLVV